MDISSQLLFFFSALGVFNGLLLSAYLFFKPQATVSNRLLSLLLLMVSLRIGKSVFFYFYPDLSKAYLQAGLSACFLIGPFLYLYCRCVQAQGHVSRTTYLLHLITPVVAVVGLGIAFPYQSYPQQWGDIAYKFINYFWLFYIVMSTVSLWPLLRARVTTQTRLNHQQILLVTVWAGTSLIWLSYFTSSFTSYIAGALSFSFVFYLTLIITLFNFKQPKTAKYQHKKIEMSDAQNMLEKMDNLMQQQTLYCDANFTLPKLASLLGLSVPKVSQLLNDNKQVSFNDYINALRIDAAKQQLLVKPALGMEHIYEACGYNSQSTFYTAFKKFTGTTPAQFRKNTLNNKSSESVKTSEL
ncbi:AraC family transcriptional regulator [Neptunicella marina]|uniref:AraC family transcriptional regulator n=1 Tax=Neptunicella marina TaxID=2125989 RepID=A0A8J6LXD1_9ALTE|nr:helix-turn-helix domain-containing protein [Neptunicella marina]MBC3765549.1 AraC family transcriptional regulator [Neptunicella marina]